MSGLVRVSRALLRSSRVVSAVSGFLLAVDTVRFAHGLWKRYRKLRGRR